MGNDQSKSGWSINTRQNSHYHVHLFMYINDDETVDVFLIAEDTPAFCHLLQDLRKHDKKAIPEITKQHIETEDPRKDRDVFLALHAHPSVAHAYVSLIAKRTLEDIQREREIVIEPTTEEYSPLYSSQ